MTMHRRRLLSAWQLALAMLALLALYLYRNRVAEFSRPEFLSAQNDDEIPPGGLN